MSWVARDDPRQVASPETFVSGGVWIPTIAVAEAMWVLGSVYELPASQLAEALEMLLNHKDLILQHAEVLASALDLFRSKPALGFSDCLMIETAPKFGHLPLGAFDRNLSKVTGAHKLWRIDTKSAPQAAEDARPSPVSIYRHIPHGNLYKLTPKMWARRLHNSADFILVQL